MRQSSTTRPEAAERRFVFGPEGLRATVLTTAAETEGRHDLSDCELPAGKTTPLHLHTRYEERLWVGTPAHLATPETELDQELFMAVTAELGDVVLGPPGTLPADLDTRDGG